MNRRGFLSSILIACVAPAIVRADSLMRIVPLETTLILPGDMAMEDLIRGPIQARSLYGKVNLVGGKVFIGEDERTWVEDTKAYGSTLYSCMGKDEFHKAITTPREPNLRHYCAPMLPDDALITLQGHG